MRKFFDVYVNGKRVKRKTLEELLDLEFRFRKIADNDVDTINDKHVIFAKFSYDDRGLKKAEFYSENNCYNDHDYTELIYDNKACLIKAVHKDKSWRNLYPTC